MAKKWMVSRTFHSRKNNPNPQSGQGFGVGPRLGHGSPLKKGTQLQTYNI